MAGAVGYVLAAACGCLWLRRLGTAVMDACVAAAALTLALHAQIEMIFFDPGTVTWALCALGIAGRAAGGDMPRRNAGIASAVVVLAMGSLLQVWRAMPSLRAQALTLEAAGVLHPRADSRQLQAEQRQAASALLLRAHDEHLPSDHRLLSESARQLLLAAGYAVAPKDAALLEAGTSLAERAVAEGGRPDASALAAEAWQIRATLSRDPADWDRAVTHARRLTEIDPHGVAPWLRLGDLLWSAGRRAEAADAYRRALDADRNRELDPLAQLAPAQRESIQQRAQP
jgi:tetratricopeptide (TPR) repeat protein